MATELNILRQILENKGKASIQLIAKQLEIGVDYVRYLYLELLKKGLVQKLKKRDWYKITSKGLNKLGKIEKPKKYPSKKQIPSKKKIRKRIKKKVSRKPPKKTSKKPERKIKKRIKRKIKKITKRKKVPKKAIKNVKAKTKKKVKKIQKKVAKVFPRKIRPEISTSLPSEKRVKSKEKTSIEKLQPPKKKFEKIIKIFKKIFYLKKDLKLW